MKTLKYHFKKAGKKKRAIGQFNFSTLEQLKGIVVAAKETKTPIILGTSEGEVKFFGMEEAILLRDRYRKDFPHIYLNLDHGKDIKLIRRAIHLGYDCIHHDGSKLPFIENIKKTKKIVKYAHKKGVLVEGEIKSIKGGSKTHKGVLKFKKQEFEDVIQAKEFVQKTKVDSLAINIGNVHGTYNKPIRLNLALLKEINKNIPVFLVLHGGSGTKQTDIKKSIKNGIVKININTELRLVWKKSFQKALKQKTIKPYEMLKPVILAIEKKTKEKLRLF
ncbi:MAG: class II fructose-bisphosphate aldolase [Patescibacteria group bacterium]|nr:class II fructose-bisphosphate aldolase [Patescibacteria group bacterium]